MNIEIYNKKTGEVIETKHLKDHESSKRSFAYYFMMQADTKKYGYREVRA